jgi:hypothetical protein
MWFAKRISGRIWRAPKLLKFEQHRQHAFELPVEVGFVAGEPFEPIEIYGFAISLRTVLRA